MSNTTVFDVAKFILDKQGIMSAMKLHKLVYYAQAWSLAWDDKPLFDNRIEAWANGPVVRDLYNKHQGKYQAAVSDVEPFACSSLSTEQQETIEAVLEAYGEKSAQWLSDQTHTEAPWLKARKGLSDNERGEQEITLDSMLEYYTSL